SAEPGPAFDDRALDLGRYLEKLHRHGEVGLVGGPGGDTTRSAKHAKCQRRLLDPRHPVGRVKAVAVEEEEHREGKRQRRVQTPYPFRDLPVELTTRSSPAGRRRLPASKEGAGSLAATGLAGEYLWCHVTSSRR